MINTYTRPKWFVGCSHVPGQTPAQDQTILTPFQTHAHPTQASHGNLYTWCIGPFSTRRGAFFYKDCGLRNPHINTAHDADRIARLEHNKGKSK